MPCRTGAALLFALCLASLLGCERKAAKEATPQTAAEVEPSPDVVEFGGEATGFVDWLERDGRFVVMHRFTEDTDGDGTINASLGDHGEPLGDKPVVTTVDLRSGDATDWDELLATDPQGLWAVLRRGDEIVALSAARSLTLEGADVTPDPSPCMPARQASIEPSGTWVSFIRNDPERVVVRNLRSDEEREFEAKHTLWRGDPTPLGWAMLREVQEDTDGDGELKIPVRRGSCACRWCSRFSTSVGAAGFAGDDFESVLVTPDGERHDELGQPLPVAPGFVWSLADNELKTLDGKPVQVGPEAGCRLLALPIGSGTLVLRCGTDTRIWDPVTGKSTPVEARIDALELFVPPRSGWIAVRVHEGDQTYVGRLSVDSGVVERGPPARRFGPTHPSGWLLAAGEDAMWAYDVHTGKKSRVGDAEGSFHALIIKRQDGWVVPEPSTGKTTNLEEQPAFVASNGCFVEPHEMARPVKGPFRYVCPQ